MLNQPRVAHFLLISAATVTAVFNAAICFWRLHWACPLTPWEAGFIVDGWRQLHGIAPYAINHATNMYGPLLNLTSGLLLRFSGVNNHTLRIFEFCCYLLAISMVAFMVVPKGWRVASFCILTIANVRSDDYFVMSNPDGAALLFVVLFLCFAYRDQILLATGALIVATLFKQPSAVAILIPLAASNFRIRWRDLFPLAGVFVTLVSFKLFFPIVWHYMFAVPRLAGFRTYRIVKAPVDLLVAMPVLIVSLALWQPDGTKKERWLIWSMLITFVAGTWMSARIGGGLNSYLLFIVAALAFCCYRLSRTSALAVVALSVILSALAYPSTSIGAANEHQGNPASYRSVIELAKNLSGRVVCPEDPTIPMYAKNYAGTDINMEMDASNSSTLPTDVRFEVANADWIITLDQAFAGKWLDESELEKLGFHIVIPKFGGSGYKLWARVNH